MHELFFPSFFEINFFLMITYHFKNKILALRRIYDTKCIKGLKQSKTDVICFLGKDIRKCFISSERH